MKKILLSILSVSFLGGSLLAQPKPTGGTYQLPVIITGNDTLPVYVMEESQYEEKLDAEEIQKQKEWNRMLYNVMKVWPYAQACSEKLQEIDSQLAAMDKKRDKNKYLKQQEDSLREQFEGQLKELTMSQGKLLVKLIDRQTGHSSYSLIKQYKSGFSAFFWQGFANMFGVSLKERYDPQKEPQIEQVIHYLGYK